MQVVCFCLFVWFFLEWEGSTYLPSSISAENLESILSFNPLKDTKHLRLRSGQSCLERKCM